MTLTDKQIMEVADTVHQSGWNMDGTPDGMLIDFARGIISRIQPAASEAGAYQRGWNAGRVHGQGDTVMVSASEAGAVPVALFGEAIAWGRVWGPKIPAKQWDQMRDEQAANFARRLVPPSALPDPVEVKRLHFVGETVPLWGYRYIECRFEDCTFENAWGGMDKCLVLRSAIAAPLSAPAAEPVDRMAPGLSRYGNLIRNLRVIAGVTLMDMAKFADRAPSYLSARECRRAAPDHNDMRQAAQFFAHVGLPIDLSILHKAAEADAKDPVDYAALAQFFRPIAPAAESAEPVRCEDCPPIGYPTDKTRCAPCDRHYLPAATADAQACPTDICQAAKQDGVLCANDECDMASGTRKADGQVKPPMLRISGVSEDVLKRAGEAHLRYEASQATADAQTNDPPGPANAGRGEWLATADAQGDERAAFEKAAVAAGKHPAMVAWKMADGSYADDGLKFGWIIRQRAALSRQPSAAGVGRKSLLVLIELYGEQRAYPTDRSAAAETLTKIRAALAAAKPEGGE